MMVTPWREQSVIQEPFGADQEPFGADQEPFGADQEPFGADFGAA
jgi:hypothetical protein